MRALFFVLPVFLALAACQNNPREKEPTGPGPEELAFAAFYDSIPAAPLPYFITEIDLQYLRHSDYRMLDSTAALYIPEMKQDAQYFGCARLPLDSSFVTLVLLESIVDSLFNATEHFLLNTYSKSGELISSIPFAGSETGEEHYKTTGILNEDGLVSTEKYKYLFENGAWEKVEQPVKIIQYQTDSTGHIRKTQTFLNIENDSSSTPT